MKLFYVEGENPLFIAGKSAKDAVRLWRIAFKEPREAHEVFEGGDLLVYECPIKALGKAEAQVMPWNEVKKTRFDLE